MPQPAPLAPAGLKKQDDAGYDIDRTDPMGKPLARPTPTATAPAAPSAAIAKTPPLGSLRVETSPFKKTPVFETSPVETTPVFETPQVEKTPVAAMPVSALPVAAVSMAAVPGNGAGHELVHVIVDRELTLASTWKRALACAIDLAVIGAVAAVHLVLALGRLPSSVGPARGTGFDRLIDAMIIYRGATIPTALVLLLLLVAYQTVFVALLEQTPGMLALRLRVLSVRHQRMGWRTALIRATAAALGLLALGAGWSLILVDRRRRTLHDRVAGTLVGAAVDQVTTISRLLPPPPPEPVSPPSDASAGPAEPVPPAAADNAPSASV